MAHKEVYRRYAEAEEHGQCQDHHVGESQGLVEGVSLVDDRALGQSVGQENGGFLAALQQEGVEILTHLLLTQQQVVGALLLGDAAQARVGLVDIGADFAHGEVGVDLRTVGRLHDVGAQGVDLLGELAEHRVVGSCALSQFHILEYQRIVGVDGSLKCGDSVRYERVSVVGILEEVAGDAYHLCVGLG